jgi:hypothetical protein
MLRKRLEPGGSPGLQNQWPAKSGRWVRFPSASATHLFIPPDQLAKAAVEQSHQRSAEIWPIFDGTSAFVRAAAGVGYGSKWVIEG